MAYPAGWTPLNPTRKASNTARAKVTSNASSQEEKPVRQNSNAKTGSARATRNTISGGLTNNRSKPYIVEFFSAVTYSAAPAAKSAGVARRLRTRSTAGITDSRATIQNAKKIVTRISARSTARKDRSRPAAASQR